MIYTTGYFFEKNRDIKIIKKRCKKKTIEISTVKDLKDNEMVIAYTTLKECKLSEHDKDNDYLIVAGASFEVFEKKKKLRRIVGYIPVGDNRFIGVQKLNLLPIILLPLILLLLLSLAFCGRNEEQPRPPVWVPNIEDVSDQPTTEDPSKNSLPPITIEGCSAITISKDTGVATVYFANNEKNPYYLEFTLYLEDGTQLYKTGDVAPGDTITRIQLNTELAEGRYAGYYHVQPKIEGVGAYTNNTNIWVDIIVR